MKQKKTYKNYLKTFSIEVFLMLISPCLCFTDHITFTISNCFKLTLAAFWAVVPEAWSTFIAFLTNDVWLACALSTYDVTKGTDRSFTAVASLAPITRLKTPISYFTSVFYTIDLKTIKKNKCFTRKK